MYRECSRCGCTPDKNGVCGCEAANAYTCGRCGSEVAVGARCFCGDSGESSSIPDNPMTFEPVEQGFRITFDNGWTVKVEKAEAKPGKIQIQAYMPEGFLVRPYGFEHFIVTSNDMAVILMQTSEIAKGTKVSAEYAAQSFEAMLEGLLFGVAA
jgi:hypothetical protein